MRAVAVALLLAGAAGLRLGAPPSADAQEDSASTDAKLEALQPVLERLKSLDPKTFGLLNGMMGQAAQGKGASLLQTPPSADGQEDSASTDAKLEALQPVLERLKNLDPKTFGLLNGMMGQAAQGKGTSLLQAPPSADGQEDSASTDAKLEALQPVLEKLKNLDPKTFGLLNGMMGQAAQGKGASLLQKPSKDDDEAPEVVQAKLEKLTPILNNLKAVNPRMFGALASVFSGVKQTQVVEQPASQDKKVAALQLAAEKIEGFSASSHAHVTKHQAEEVATQKQGTAAGAGVKMSSSTESWLGQRFGDLGMLGKEGEEIVEEGAKGKH